jgi:hypothetical protein
MHALLVGSVVLAVRHPGARAHPLHVAGTDHRAVAERIAVREAALEHVADDLHVAMAVGAESLPGLDAILVDHAQRAEAHVIGIVVAGEGEAVEGVEPAMLRMAALLAAADLDHVVVLCVC